MRVLLALCTPKPLKRHLPEHEAVHASEVP